MNNHHLSSKRGFTLQEMLIVLVSLGVVVACSIPAVVQYRDSQQLQNVTHTLVGQIRLARSIALTTGVAQPITFETDSRGALYHVDNPDGTVRMSGRLPSDLMYDARTNHRLTLKANGHADRPGVVVVCDYSGRCDTVSVEKSGFAIAK